MKHVIHNVILSSKLKLTITKVPKNIYKFYTYIYVLRWSLELLITMKGYIYDRITGIMNDWKNECNEKVHHVIGRKTHF